MIDRGGVRIVRSIVGKIVALLACVVMGVGVGVSKTQVVVALDDKANNNHLQGEICMRQGLKDRKKKVEKTNPTNPISVEMSVPDVGNELDEINDLLTKDIDDILESTGTERELFDEDDYLRIGGCGCGG